MPTVLVTGASRGLGLELTRQYAADGWTVLAGVRTPVQADALQALVQSSRGRIEVQELDVGEQSSVAALAGRIGERSIDVLINSAGTMGRRSFAAEGLAMDRFGAADFDDWQHVFQVNVFGPMRVAQALISNVAASKQKRIVSLTSVIGSIAGNTQGGLYAYRASKAALNAVMRSMAIDLQRSHGIIAAVLHPGWVRTEMGGPRADLDAATSVAGMRAVIASLTPQSAGRFWMHDGSELPW